MTSHEFANKLREVADFLTSKPEFDAMTSKLYLPLYYWGDKEQFLSAVRALGAGKKEYENGLGGDLVFYPTLPTDTQLALRVNRSAVCRKIQDEKWECEPLLSQEEEAEIA